MRILSSLISSVSDAKWAGRSVDVVAVPAMKHYESRSPAEERPEVVYS